MNKTKTFYWLWVCVSSVSFVYSKYQWSQPFSFSHLSRTYADYLYVRERYNEYTYCLCPNVPCVFHNDWLHTNRFEIDSRVRKDNDTTKKEKTEKKQQTEWIPLGKRRVQAFVRNARKYICQQSISEQIKYDFRIDNITSIIVMKKKKLLLCCILTVRPHQCQCHCLRPKNTPDRE